VTPGPVRRALHHVHAATALGLAATGWLVGSPELRARIVGGFGRELLDLHVALGLAFLAAPAAALLLAGRALVADARRRLGPPDPPWAWRKVHLASTLVLAALLGASGLVLWRDPGLPPAALDASLAVHEVSTWVLVLALPVHLVAARRRIAERWRARGRAAPAPLHEDADGRPLWHADDDPASPV
jgi:hypothetical protein